jgi:glycosyltransferase involved in cell wall biosynthesis
MSYLSAGKPIVASIDRMNAGAKILIENSAGIVVPPDAPIENFGQAVIEIISNPNLQISMGISSAQYAYKNFDGAKAAEFFMLFIRKQ